MKHNLVVGDIVKFTVYPSLFHKLDHVDLTYQGEISAGLCSQFNTDAYSEWVRCYPSLPEGVVNDADKYPWLIFKTINDAIVVVNEEWINSQTLVVSGGTVIWVTETRGNNVTPDIIRKQLSSVGIELIRTYVKGTV
jgi:hypothetical protein